MADVDEPVRLSGYDPQWADLFQAEAERISAAMPAGAVIEHIGSTAVPGMLAKPVIDIMVGVPPDQDTAMFRSILVAIGYEDLDEAGVPGRIYLRKRSAGAFNIALVRHGGAHWIANLALRDYLRSNAAARLEYAEVKRRALDQGIRSLLAYSGLKSDVVRRLIANALGSESP